MVREKGRRSERQDVKPILDRAACFEKSVDPHLDALRAENARKRDLEPISTSNCPVLNLDPSTDS